MKNAVFSLVAVLVLSALVGALKPRGALGKGVGFLCSLFVLLAVISPFLNMEHGNLDIPIAPSDTGEKNSSDWLVENSALQIARSVSELVEQKFGYSGVPVTVTLDSADKSAVRLISVSVDMRGLNATKRVYEIEAELEKDLLCEVEVMVR